MRSPLKTLFLTLILLVTVLHFPLAIGEPDWLAGWDHRVKITIDSGDIDTALTDFPILVYLSDSSGIDSDNLTFIFDEIGFNYLKLAITEDDSLTECYVEVEGWDSVNDKGWLWTKIPSISNITDTEIYLYYDNDHADNTAYVGVTTTTPAENVWDSNFELVYHMRDKGVNEEMWDSTDNDVDGDKKAVNEPNMVSGIIDKAQDFDGTNDYITAPSLTFEDDTVGTIEAWAKRDTLDQYCIVVGASDDDSNANNLDIMWRTDDKIWIWVRPNAGYEFVKETTNTWRDTYWHYLVFTQNGTLPKLYVDAVDQPLVDILGPADNGGWFDDIGAGLEHFDIGMARDKTPSDPFPGIIDEVRISDIERSGSWIKATHETGIDDLLDYGDEVSLPPDPTEFFGAGFNASSPYVTLRWSWENGAVTLYEVQNSTDGISWDYLGTNTTTEYHDFEVENGTDRYYRVRACRFEGGGWFNSSWSDVDFETVYFITGGVIGGDGVVVLTMGKYYALAIILLILGLLIGLGMRRKR